jgi:hypothetical protein
MSHQLSQRFRYDSHVDFGVVAPTSSTTLLSKSIISAGITPHRVSLGCTSSGTVEAVPRVTVEAKGRSAT